MKILFILFSAAFFSISIFSQDNEGGIRKGPDFSLEDLSGDFVELNQEVGEGPILLSFWATWCKPCVEELPAFQKLHKTYKDKNVEVILVSLDFPHLYETKLKPFIKEKKIASKVIALDDVDMNSWIPQISKAWSGSIPATIIYKNNISKFFERSFTFEELEKETLKVLN